MFKRVTVLIFFFALLIIFKFQVNGQCNDDHDYRTVTKCDGSFRSGSAVYVDFGKIGGPCTCIVTSMFIGVLHVLSWRSTNVLCRNRVTVNNNTVVFNCKDEGFEKFFVKFNDTIIVKAEYQPGHTFERFYQCLGFINYSIRNFSVKCGPPPHLPTISSITTTTVYSTVPRLIESSLVSIVSSKESKVTLNNKNGAFFSTTYVLNTSTADLKSSSQNSTTTYLENKKGKQESTTHRLKTTTADSNSLSKKPTAEDAETKKNANFTTTYVLKTSTDDLKYSLEIPMNRDSEGISVLAASIATGGIVLAIALIVCITIILNRFIKERNIGLALKSATLHTNKACINSNDLPTSNPLNNIYQHVDEVGEFSEQNKQLGLTQTASKLNRKNTTEYDVPPINKPLYQGEYSFSKNVVTNKDATELCPDIVIGDMNPQSRNPTVYTYSDESTKL